MPRVQANDFSFNPYQRNAPNGPAPAGSGDPHRSTPGSAPGSAAAAGGFVYASPDDNMMDDIVPLSPNGTFSTTPQKNQRNN